MAPVTRSNASKAGKDPAAPPAPPAKAAASKAKKPKTPKRPAAIAKVQKKKGSPKKKNGKGRKASSEPTSNKSSSSASSKKASSRGPSRSSSKASASSSKKKTGKAPRPTEDDGPAQDDFPELTQAYGMLPYLNQPQSTSAPRTPSFVPDVVLRPDINALDTQLAHHMVNVPAWSSNRPGTGVRGFASYLPRGFELAKSPPPQTPQASRPLSQQGRGTSSNANDSAHDRRRREPRVTKRSSSESRRRASGVARDIAAEVESQSPVSVKNAQVFKRPTVGNVRRERGQLHDELHDWVVRLRRARDDFDEVIGEIEGRMQILKAVNRMQAPLRKAPLGRGR